MNKTIMIVLFFPTCCFFFSLDDETRETGRIKIKTMKKKNGEADIFIYIYIYIDIYSRVAESIDRR